jgi:arylamine N-acetyltransferase
MNVIHDAPHLTVSETVFRKFLDRTGINPLSGRSLLVNRVAEAFSVIPYENLTKIIKADSVISARSAMRFPDELIGDWLRWGTGGTCFSLTAAIIAVYNSLGIETHPVLADRHYGPDTHCGLVIIDENGMFLLDPGYLLFTPVKTPVTGSVSVTTGFNTIELRAVDLGKVELHTIVKGNRKPRLVYKMKPVDPRTFARAWEQSFSWEMMTYPVLTRGTAGKHTYLQGNKLAVRTDHGTERITLSPENQIDYITSHLGISKEIVNRAMGVIKNGANT